MRVLAPILSLEADRAVVTARFESATSAFAPIDVHLWAPRDLAGRLDVSATPFLPIAAVISAALGEDMTSDGPASPATVAGAVANTATMAGWWQDDGWRAPIIAAPPAAPLAADPSRGHGLFFSLGVDSWASLLTLLEQDRRANDPQDQPLTHLVTIDGIDRPRQPAAHRSILITTRRVATAVGLPLVEVGTDVRDLLDPIDVWDHLHGAVLAAFGLLLGPALHTITIAGSHSDSDRPQWGSHIELDHRWSSESTRIVHHLGSTDRADKVAIVAGNDLARQTLLVCWESGEAANCGHCPKCLRTMTALHLAGALEISPTFPPVVDPDEVRASRHDSTGFVAELVERLPPGELRAAWQSHLEPSLGRRRLVNGDARPMAGLSAVARVNLALAGTGWQADPPSPDPAVRSDVTDDALVLGWESGMVPLRPARRTHRFVTAAMADHRSRPFAWVLADEADRQRVNDPGPAAVADAAERAWVDGICYLAGIGWGQAPVPVLALDAVGRLLDAARVRLWWRGDGTLDPLRVVESIEHGCLPLQVMPTGVAASLRTRLPAPLAPLVVGLAEVPSYPIDADTTARRLAAVATLVLAGSAERDLAADAAFHPVGPDLVGVGTGDGDRRA